MINYDPFPQMVVFGFNVHKSDIARIDSHLENVMIQTCLRMIVKMSKISKTKLSECVGHERQEIQTSDNKEKHIILKTATHTKAVFRYLYKTLYLNKKINMTIFPRFQTIRQEII